MSRVLGIVAFVHAFIVRAFFRRAASVHLVDTAGLRDTDEAVEQEGVRRARARQAVRDAGIAMLVVEDGAQLELGDYLADIPDSARPVIVWNKIDNNTSHQQAANGLCHKARLVRTTYCEVP